MNKKNSITVHYYRSPYGEMVIGALGNKICLCDWKTAQHNNLKLKCLTNELNAEFEEGYSDIIEKTEKQLDEYFSKQRVVFDIPLILTGTDFQKTVWNELEKIPYGATVSYGTIAQRIGMSKAVRAVANAIGANKISVIIPCHRVIGSDNTLTGYDGGLETKTMLLKTEGTVS